jgi:hypothetical protein
VSTVKSIISRFASAKREMIDFTGGGFSVNLLPSIDE